MRVRPQRRVVVHQAPPPRGPERVAQRLELPLELRAELVRHFSFFPRLGHEVVALEPKRRGGFEEVRALVGLGLREALDGPRQVAAQEGRRARPGLAAARPRGAVSVEERFCESAIPIYNI